MSSVYLPTAITPLGDRRFEQKIANALKRRVTRSKAGRPDEPPHADDWRRELF